MLDAPASVAKLALLAMNDIPTGSFIGRSFGAARGSAPAQRLCAEALLSSALPRAPSTSAASKSKVLLFLASANRDPRRWDEPEPFDVNRRAAGHVAFGAGIHLCVGQMLARLETEMLMTALAAG